MSYAVIPRLCSMRFRDSSDQGSAPKMPTRSLVCDAMSTFIDSATSPRWRRYDGVQAMAVVPRSFMRLTCLDVDPAPIGLSLIHISEPTRLGMISYAVFCLKKK